MTTANVLFFILFIIIYCHDKSFYTKLALFTASHNVEESGVKLNYNGTRFRSGKSKYFRHKRCDLFIR